MQKVSIIVIILLIILPHVMADNVFAADNRTFSVSAVVLSKNNCKLGSDNATLNFGNIDPAKSMDVIISSTVTFICHGCADQPTFYVSDDDGLYETGPNANRMRHTTMITEYLPYAFTLNPESSTVPKNATQILTITGTVRAFDYQNAYPGDYSDTIVITIEP